MLIPDGAVMVPIFGIVSTGPTVLIILGLVFFVGKRVVQQVLAMLGTAT